MSMSPTAELFIVAAVWTLIAAFIARFVPNWIGRVAVFAILVGIPFWELPYGYYNFATLCKREAKLLVYEKILPQNTICVDDLYSDVYRMLATVGFARIEMKGRTNLRQGDMTGSQVVRVRGGEEKSLYCFSSVSNLALPWRISRADRLINRSSDGRSVLRQSEFSWGGMWWQEEARPILGKGGRCEAPLSQVFVAVRNGTN